MSLPDRRLALLPALALIVLTAACGGGGEGTPAAAPAIPVAASDDGCDVEASELEAGTHQFEVTNAGSKITEFYVYAEGDRVMVAPWPGEDDARAPDDDPEAVAPDRDMELRAHDDEHAVAPADVPEWADEPKAPAESKRRPSRARRSLPKAQMEDDDDGA